MILEKTAGSADEAPLLGQSHAFRAAAVAIVAAIPDLGEYQGIPIPHDQVDFTESRLVVALQGLHAATVQE
jgi:hypothetical protein